MNLQAIKWYWHVWNSSYIFTTKCTYVIANLGLTYNEINKIFTLMSYKLKSTLRPHFWFNPIIKLLLFVEDLMKLIILFAFLCRQIQMAWRRNSEEFRSNEGNECLTSKTNGSLNWHCQLFLPIPLRREIYQRVLIRKVIPFSTTNKCSFDKVNEKCETTTAKSLTKRRITLTRFCFIPLIITLYV